MSTITILLGLYCAICLTSSEPIEPPPPVIIQTLPSTKVLIDDLSNVIGGLPSKSSILISLTWFSSLVPSSPSSRSSFEI